MSVKKVFMARTAASCVGVRTEESVTLWVEPAPVSQVTLATIVNAAVQRDRMVRTAAHNAGVKGSTQGGVILSTGRACVVKDI